MMFIGDPEDLKKVDGFAGAYAESCRRNCLNHKGFLGPGDRFGFTCKRTNVCCKDFSSNDGIILEPYDVLRLSRKLHIATGRFMKEYADLALDRHTHFPIALLKYKGRGSRNKCVFLRSYGCWVYEDRPLRCRLYPLGRILDQGKSYFILIDNCRCGDAIDDESWSVQEWIDISRAEEYLEHQALISELFSSADWDAYRNLGQDTKLALGKTLYNIYEFLQEVPAKSRPVLDTEIMLSLRRWLEGFLIEHRCLETRCKTEPVTLPSATPETKSEYEAPVATPV